MGRDTPKYTFVHMLYLTVLACSTYDIKIFLLQPFQLLVISTLDFSISLTDIKVKLPPNRSIYRGHL